MKHRLWYGYLKERSGNGTIIVFDHRAPGLPKGQVYLFHYKRNEILIYEKDIVRSKLRPITQIEESVLSAVDSAYFAARSKLSERILKKKSHIDLSDNFQYLVNDPESQKEISEFARDYADSLARSEDDGWFYDDSESDDENNLAGPNSENA